METDITEMASKKRIDFKKSVLDSNSPIQANGVTNMIISVQFINSNNTFVKDHQFEIEVSPDTGTTISGCTRSNAFGAAVCLLRSTSQGTKQVRVKNVPINLAMNVVFTTPSAPQILGMVSASDQNVTAGPYTVQWSLGEPVRGIYSEPGGNQIYKSTQGVLVSE